VGKLDGKVAVITGGSSGMALAGAKLFVEEGAHVFISGRRQQALDEAVKLIGRNVAGVEADSANLDDLDRIRVNVLTPGQVVTPGQEQMFDDETKAAMKAREALIPRGKNGSPQEIATVALFLASNDSRYVNGTELIVDGGTTAI